MIDDTGSLTPADASVSRLQLIEDNLSHYLDVTAAILLSIATVATAWCVYQATNWSGEQARAYAEASSSRIESTREYNRAMQLLVLDSELFIGWVAAFNADDQQTLAFYESNLMRESFLPHLNEWRASQPLENPDAMPNPIVSAEYQRELFAESVRLREEAELLFEDATEANEISSDFVLSTVIFASVLFFAGISAKFISIRIQLALVGMALLTFVIGVFQIGWLPTL